MHLSVKAESSSIRRGRRDKLACLIAVTFSMATRHNSGIQNRNTSSPAEAELLVIVLLAI